MYRDAKSHKGYFGKPRPSDCPFCNLTEQEIVEDRGRAWVVRNIHPYKHWDLREATDHLMIVPKRHVETIGALPKEEQEECLEIMTEYEARGYDIFARAAISSIKTVAHQHTHLIKTSGRRFKWIFWHSGRPYFLLRG